VIGFRPLAFVLFVAAIGTGVRGAAVAAARPVSGDWSGTYTLPRSAGAVPFSVSFAKQSAIVAIDFGHAQSQTVHALVRGASVRFGIPGRPAAVSFRGTLHGAAILGSVSQGTLRGTFRLHRGDGAVARTLGLYADGLTVVHFANDPTVPYPLLVHLDSGDINGVGGTGPTFTIGRRIGDRGGAGTLRADPRQLMLTGQEHTRLAVRQFEVRLPSSGATLAGTLTLPPGTGPFAAAAIVHGSGDRPRGDFQPFVAFLAAHGVASLVYDKRGVGESGGTYPGDRASDSTIDILATDAAAAARFLASQREVDATRVGLMGDSQGGWVIALAASREHAVRWSLLLVGPTVTVDESDGWGRLAGQGTTSPSGTFAEMEAQIRASGPGGFDPAPYVQTLTIPMFWIYGDDDRNVPTDLCVQRLQAIDRGHDFSWTVLHTTHTLLDLPSGMNADIPRSRGYAAGLFAAMGTWLHAHGIER
jgi:uncharacterized protein